MASYSVEGPDYNFNRTDSVVVDANVWLLLNTPGQAMLKSENRRSAAYSSIYKRLIVCQSRLFVPQVVLSEYINRLIQMSFGQRSNRALEFKEFRETPAYSACMIDIERAVHEVFQVAERLEFPFANHPINDVMTDLKDTKMDYTDVLLSHICLAENAILLTDDRDFQFCNKEITIVTANQRWLDELQD